MVSIPGGTFTMGSPVNEPNRYNDETQHQVTLSGFKMSKYQVTQEQYQAVMGNAEDRTIIDYGKGDNYPIYYVNWYDAIVFCNKLSIKEGLNPVYSINGSTNPSNWGNIPTNSNETWNAAAMDKNKSGYRLPTEAEWEYACRAGTITPFNTGDNITTDQSNYNGNFPYNGNVTGINRGQTTPVENFAPNAYGLYDMHGNLNEWCWDWYKADITEDNANPTGVANGTSRVERGGYWGDAGQYLRSAYRGKNAPNTRSYMIGFRLVRP
ncbi:formylglycine-generating enzyme family protein [Treponema sp. R6D11]